MKRARRGQSTVEYLLLLSVISIAVGAVTLTFSDTVQVQTRAVSQWLAEELTGNGAGNHVQ